MMERAKDIKRKKDGVEQEEFDLEEPGNPATKNSCDGTKLDNFVSFGEEGRNEASHTDSAESCKKTRIATLETGRLDQRLMQFLLKNGVNWEMKDIPAEVLEIMNKMTDVEGRQGLLVSQARLAGDEVNFKVQNSGGSDLEACFQFP
ncbi:unnamed protein product [Urochloa humidicola]